MRRSNSVAILHALDVELADEIGVGSENAASWMRSPFRQAG
jgi:hypothetical protein